MPIFEYICRDCETHFETIVTPSRPASCPSCHGGDLAKQHSVFAVASGSPGRSAASAPSGPGACGTCGDPRGPGSCSLN